MRERLVRWSARLERAALAFARSWVEDDAEPNAERVVDGCRRRSSGERATDGAPIAGSESPPDDWLRYVTARSQAPDGSRAYPQRAATDSAASPPAASRPPLRTSGRLAAWAHARLPRPRRADQHEPASVTPSQPAGKPGLTSEAHDDDRPGGADRQPLGSATAAPRASEPVSPSDRPHTRAPQTPGTRPPPRTDEPCAASVAVAAKQPVEPARREPQRGASTRRFPEWSDSPRALPSRARLVPGAVAHPDDARAAQGTPRAPNDHEPTTARPSPGAASNPRPVAALPVPALDTRGTVEAAGRQANMARLETSSPRACVPAAAECARAQLGRAELTPRVRLRVSAELTRAEPERRALAGAGAQRTGERHVRLHPREPARAAAAPSLAGVPAPRGPGAEPHGPAAARSRAAAARPPAHDERHAMPFATVRSRSETERSRLQAGCAFPSAARAAAEPATRSGGGDSPEFFPELPRRDGAAVTPRRAPESWPELPPSTVAAVTAEPLDRCDRLLREQSEV